MGGYGYSLSDAIWYPGYYHVFKGPWDSGGEVYRWCLERFGAWTAVARTWEKREKEMQGRWGSLSQRGGTTFVFRDDNDAFQFRMRWS